MKDYRAFILRDGHVAHAEVIRAEADIDAVVAAMDLIGIYDVEIWQLDRKIATLHMRSQEDHPSAQS